MVRNGRRCLAQDLLTYTCMCPPPPQNCEFNCVKYSFCEPLNTCIYVKKKIKLVCLFAHTILKLLLYLHDMDTSNMASGHVR